MKHIWACKCGEETEVEREDFNPGKVFQCPACETIWACVLTKLGPRVWIKVDKKTADFHRLLEEPTDEDETDV